ncbi:MAG: 4-hydroxythreonine-4-phosphate dehydrogenase PdxA, partial [Cyclobacteriaceae bacterium]|nr:4-hydroxythreonine-4-phosphate dehydrogenase PdxA [Cyclobacteriaceae bacterium]
MQTKKQRPILGISIGDVNGIGVEVILKSLSDARVYSSFTPVIYGHGRALTHYKKLLQLEEIQFTQIRSSDEIQPRKLQVINCMEECPEILPGVETQEAGNLA